MKKILLILSIILISIFIVDVKADTITDYQTCTTDNNSRKYTIQVGESVTINCNKELNSSGACDHSLFSDINDTGVCKNPNNWSLPFNEHTGTALLDVTGNKTSGYTLTARNIGTNQFWCDKDDKCYEFTVTDENGNTANDINPLSYLEYAGSSEKRRGYGCYYLTSEGTGAHKFVFYTNRNYSSTGGRNLTATINGGVSLDECAVATEELMLSSNSNVTNNLHIVVEKNTTKGAYDIFNAGSSSNTDNILVLYGKGFDVLYPDDSMRYDGSFFSSRLISEDFANAIGVGNCYNNINSEQDFLECFGCNSSQSTSCSTSIYTPGVISEPDTVSGVEISTTDPVPTDGNGNGNGDNSGENDGFGGEELYLTCDDVKYATQAYNTIRILAPVLLIIFGSLDFFKAIVAGDVKKQQEARSKFPKRLIALLLLVLLPFVVQFIFSTFGRYGSQKTNIFCCVVSNGNQNCNYVSDSNN